MLWGAGVIFKKKSAAAFILSRLGARQSYPQCSSTHQQWAVGCVILVAAILASGIEQRWRAGYRGLVRSHLPNCHSFLLQPSVTLTPVTSLEAIYQTSYVSLSSPWRHRLVRVCCCILHLKKKKEIPSFISGVQCFQIYPFDRLAASLECLSPNACWDSFYYPAALNRISN